MKNIARISLVSIILFSIVIVIAGCAGMNRQASSTPQGSENSALTAEQATEIVENAMNGFATGNYTIWSRDWTDAMKDAIKEGDFLSYRQQVIANYGGYQSIASIEKLPGQTKGFVRWSVIANFEKGQIRFSFGFKEDGNRVEGVFPEVIASR
ncbi:MAG: DUF3887 domain-containing protein [Caldilineaceae bacterium]|nr:DUF3887 domain-containing protein [Caldilineaceae bacterium]